MTGMTLSPTELARLWQDAALMDAEWGDNQGCDVRKAVDALLTMQSRIAELEEVLRQIAAECVVPLGTDKQMYARWRKLATERVDIARAALKEKTNG